MVSIEASKTFAFETSRHVLAFAIRAAQLADGAAVGLQVRQGFGRATVTLSAEGDLGAVPRMLDELDRAAQAVRTSTRGAGLRTARPRGQSAGRAQW